MFEGPFEDRLLIRERYGAYSDSAFRQDVDAWLANWTDNGIWVIFGQEIRGKEALRAQWDSTWRELECMGFFSEIGAISVKGDTASARSYCREIVLLKTGEVMKVVGCYEDELVKDSGVWLFARRDYSVLIHESG